MSSHDSVITSLPMSLKSLISTSGLEIHLSVRTIQCTRGTPKQHSPDKFISLLSCSPLSFVAPVMFSDGIITHLLSCPARNFSHLALFFISHIQSDIQTYKVKVYIWFKKHLQSTPFFPSLDSISSNPLYFCSRLLICIHHSHCSPTGCPKRKYDYLIHLFKNKFLQLSGP